MLDPLVSCGILYFEMKCQFVLVDVVNVVAIILLFYRLPKNISIFTRTKKILNEKSF